MKKYMKEYKIYPW